MSDVEIDRHQAAAEAALDRVDDREAIPDDVDPSDAAALEFVDGMHVEEAGVVASSTDDDDDDVVGHITVLSSELIDEIAEAFNARDFDSLEELCSDDCETPGLSSDLEHLSDAIADLWERRPTMTLTREELEESAVGVMWEREETAGWAPVGTLHVDITADGLAGVLEFSDDVGLLDELTAAPPDGDLDEGFTWSEWDDGSE